MVCCGAVVCCGWSHPCRHAAFGCTLVSGIDRGIDKVVWWPLLPFQFDAQKMQGGPSIHVLIKLSKHPPLPAFRMLYWNMLSEFPPHFFPAVDRTRCVFIPEADEFASVQIDTLLGGPGGGMQPQMQVIPNNHASKNHRTGKKIRRKFREHIPVQYPEIYFTRMSWKRGMRTTVLEDLTRTWIALDVSLSTLRVAVGIFVGVEATPPQPPFFQNVLSKKNLCQCPCQCPCQYPCPIWQPPRTPNQ